MKIYIYELDFFNSRVITEYSCEAEAKNKIYVRENRKSFPAIWRTQINKTPMPRLIDKNTVVSIEPLTEKQVKEFFLKNEQEDIARMNAIISKLTEKIERIKGAEFIKGQANIEKGEK